ncbi:MAG TPA: Obg family GTPase CgtA, partial [Patescibacteria group bacterium]|nr:Obg family GTPase CgtA [Patescibacteria group bacterium]
NVYFCGVTNLTALNKYRHKKEFWAPDGQKGKSNRMDGHNGEDLILTVSIGTLIKNIDSGKKIDIINTDQKELVAKGGIGGRGNFYFRSPTNTTPKEYEKGKKGETFDIILELRLIADIGLIGFPNAGKSSLLNELTKADVKVANYEFTTLEPNLGVMDRLIIADIPGLIEGASKGKGLGVKFLKHIQRTRVLAHCISLESNDIESDYMAIRRELNEFNSEIIEKKEIIILTKTDLIEKNELENKIKIAKKLNPEVLTISIHDWDSIIELKKYLKDLFPVV